MEREGRIRPLQRLFVPASGGEGSAAARARLRLDPERAWAGRVSLDTARVRCRPDDADAWWRLGAGLQALGRHETASAAFARAFRLDLGAGVPPGQRMAVFCSLHRRGLEFVGDIAASLQGSGLPFAWLCAEPLGFDRVREALGPQGGRAYRMDPLHLEALLSAPRARASVVAMVNADADLAVFPGDVPRVRLPRTWVEDPGSERFDAVLCPTRPFAARWAGSSPAAQRCLKVAWPEARVPVPLDAETCPTLTLTFDAPAESDAAWPDAAWLALARALLTELPAAQLVLRAAGERQLAVRTAWRSESERWGPRVRIETTGTRAETSSQVVIAEPLHDAVARALRGSPHGDVFAFDPHAWFAGETAVAAYDAPLRAVAAVHERLHRPAAFVADRKRARQNMFFRGDAQALSLEAALHVAVTQI